MYDRETTATELKRFLKAKGLKQSDIAGALGTKQSYVSAVLSGKRPIGPNTAQRLQRAFGLNAGWLMTGEGDMLVSEGSASVHMPLPNVLVGTTPIAAEPSRIGYVDIGMTQETPIEPCTVAAKGESGLDRTVETLQKQVDALIRQNELLTKNLDMLTRQLEAVLASRDRHGDV